MDLLLTILLVAFVAVVAMFAYDKITTHFDGKDDE
jgi:hypothetical protein